jgi:SulP family sulfate permease
MVHALTLLVILLFGARAAAFIPMSVLAAILFVVAWNMGEWREFAHLRQFRMPYRITLLSVFLLTVVFDLTVAVEVGLVAACITFIYRISSLSRCEPVQDADIPTLTPSPGRVAGYRLYGALFFGAVKLVEDLQDHLPVEALVLDLKNVIYIDSSGADTLNDLARACTQAGVRLVVCGLSHQPLDIAQRCGFYSSVGAQYIYPHIYAGMASVLATAQPPSCAPVKCNKEDPE